MSTNSLRNLFRVFVMPELRLLKLLLLEFEGDNGDASRRNRINSGSYKGSLMTEMTDISVRLSPERMDQARDLVVDTDETASTSRSSTLL
jgi:hypothetical protein